MQNSLSYPSYDFGQEVATQQGTSSRSTVSHTRDRIQWQLALRNLALQQSKYFPTFQQWLQTNHNLPGTPTIVPPPHSTPAANNLDSQRYRHWCSHVRTCLFIGNPVLDYQEWCSQ